MLIAGMKHPRVRGKGLLLSGQCLLYKYFTSAPESEHPWPEELVEKIKVQKRRRQRKYRQIKKGVHLADTSEILLAGEAALTDQLLEEVGKGSTGPRDSGKSVTVETDGEGEALDVEEHMEEDIPLDAEEQADLDQQIMVSKRLHIQCENTLKEALAVAMSQKVRQNVEVDVLINLKVYDVLDFVVR